MSRPRRLRPAAFAVAAALLLLLTGCVRIPLESGVSTAPIGDAGGNDDLLVLPESPLPGASPREILQGFVQAGRGPQNGYAVAAEFLTDDFASRWRPGAGVLVTSSPIAPAEAGEDSLSLSLSVVAELDAHGRYTSAPAATERELVFQFAQEDGEWRISDGPDGTVLSPSSFDAIFEPVELHFFSQDYRFLVPELRWFVGLRTISNRVVDELLAADSPLLAAGVLRTAFPTGTERLAAVGVDRGRASVTLSSEVLAVDGVTQSRLLEQLERSLRSLGDVQSATIVAGGFPMPISPISEVDRLQVGAVPVAVEDGAFGTVGPSGLTPLEGIGDAVDGLGARAVSLGRGRDAAAVLTADGVALVSPDGVQLLDERSGLAAPSLDPWGWVWSAPRDEPSELVALAASGARRSLGPDVEGRVVALQLSRDGTRLLLVVDTSRGARAIVWGIERDADLAPAALVEPVLVAESEELLDAGWVDGVSIALLGAGDSSPVTVVPLGGRSSGLGAVVDGVQLVGGNGVDGIRVRDAAGRIWRPGGETGWLDTGWTASFLGVQQ